MPLNVRTHVEDGFAVFQLAGSLTLSPSLNNLRNTARELLTGTKLKGVILNVGDVTAADSAGLGELTVVYTIASRHGSPIRLVAVPVHLQKMLGMTRLDGLLPSARDIAAAKAEIKTG
jgi:anti-anti-sigma factor